MMQPYARCERKKPIFYTWQKFFRKFKILKLKKTPQKIAIIMLPMILTNVLYGAFFSFPNFIPQTVNADSQSQWSCQNPIVIDFETDALGNPIVGGQVLDNEFLAYGITISADSSSGRNIDLAIAFDSVNPTGGDGNLDHATPNEAYGGLGVGNDGVPSNNVPLGNHLAIASNDEDNDGDGIIDVPDPDQPGRIFLTFQNPMRAEQTTFIDIDDSSNQDIVYYFHNGNNIDNTPIPSAGNNSVQNLTLNNQIEITQLKFDMESSFGIDNIILCPVQEKTSCGDGTVQMPNDEGTGGPNNDGNEACDTNDGYDPSTHRCNNQCILETLTYCGDGAVQEPNETGSGGPNNDGYEQCDQTDGYNPLTQRCNDSCVIEEITYCGDNVIQTPNDKDLDEVCDDGSENGVACSAEYGQTCSYCSNICTPIELTGADCNDGVLNEDYEECDGELGVGQHQTCSNECKLINLTYCGDSIIQTPNDAKSDGPENDGNEACDAGDKNGTACEAKYGESCSYCTNECVSVEVTGPFCGDGFINGSEDEQKEFIRGDINNDLVVDITDLTNLGFHLTNNTTLPCQDSADVNDDGVINQDDHEYLYSWLFQNETTQHPDPASPGPFVSGPDPTEDNLTCSTSFEACDDGNENDTDGCTNQCRLPEPEAPDTYCGDGSVQTPNDVGAGGVENDGNESCDVGDNNGTACEAGYGQSCAYCTTECVLVDVTGPFCGDGSVNGSENETQLFIRGDLNRDGTVNITDHTSLNLYLTSSITLPCQDTADVNDDGVVNTQDRDDLWELLTQDRLSEILAPGAFTQGVDPTEDELVCGNTFEACDDGNEDNTDECTNQCRLPQPPAEGPSCGDGNVDSQEQCDDGNIANGDGCSERCQTESTPPPTPPSPPSGGGGGGSTVRNPRILVEKTANKELVCPNDEILYSIRLTNIGNRKGTNLQLTDTLPSGFTLKDSGATSFEQGFGDINVGGVKEISYSVIVAANVFSGRYTNLASATIDNAGSLSQATALAEVRVGVCPKQTETQSTPPQTEPESNEQIITAPSEPIQPEGIVLGVEFSELPDTGSGYTMIIYFSLNAFALLTGVVLYRKTRRYGIYL